MKVFQISSIIIIGMLSLGKTFSQAKITSIKISNIHSAYIDRAGELYIIQPDSISKFDIDGKFVQKIPLSTVTNFDPRDGARYFFYYRFLHQFGFLAGNTVSLYPIERHYAIEPIMACASGDNHVWILDRADWSLKKIDPKQSKVVADALIDQRQFDKKPEFVFMREYQQFLFLIEKEKGIIIFNGIGKQIKKIESKGIDNMNFFGEELYYKKGNRLIFVDLFDASVRETEIDPACRFILLSDVRRFLIYPDRIEIFENP